MKIKFFIFSLIFVFCCKSSTKTYTKIIWTEAQVLCVHWSTYARENFKTPAISFKVDYCNLQSIDSIKFRLYDPKILEDTLDLYKGSPTALNDGCYSLKIHLNAELLTSRFKEGSNQFGDDCFQIELANMLGNGILIMTDHKNNRIVEKSPDFHFFIGIPEN